MDDYTAYRSAELAELYDAIYSDEADIGFWRALADTVGDGPLLELGCGTGRVLLPLARDGHRVTGLDLATHMLDRGRTKLGAEVPRVRDRVTLLEADMTSFDLGERFALIFCAFGTFNHLTTAEQQIMCLERCRDHLSPGGTLVLDLFNPDPAVDDPAAQDSSASALSGREAARLGGRQVRGWATVVGHHPASQYNDVEVTYEIVGPDGNTRHLSERFPMRFVFRYELEHLLHRCGFRLDAVYGDYDRSGFVDGSLGMIAVATSRKTHAEA